MNVLIVLSVVVAVCYSQPEPARPKPSETFQSEVDVVFHEHQRVIGKGKISRDEASKEGIEDIKAMQGDREESRVRLERYDMGKEFFIRGSGDQMHCEERNVNDTALPHYWDWVEKAKYAGKKEVQNRTLDVWESHGPGMFLELLVFADDVNTPLFVNASLGANIRETKFLDFKPTTPPATDFTVPQICQQ